MATEEQWHQFEALRDDGAPARFRIRDLTPRTDQPRIFVVELPYPITDLSRLPDATSYRRIATFEERWLIPAAGTLGWTFVAAKVDDGSCFLYLYGADDPAPMIERLAPFDGGLGFFDESDPAWDEYAALKELLDEANAIPVTVENDDSPTTLRSVVDEDAMTTLRPVAGARAKRAAAAPTIPIATAKAKAKAKAAGEPAATSPPTKQAAAKKPAKKSPAKKPPAKKPAKKSPAKKSAAKKSAAKKPAAKKPAAKKPGTKRR